MPFSIQQFLLLGSLITSVLAVPQYRAENDGNHDRYGHKGDKTVAPPALPSLTLPAPTGLTLKAITVGTGTQNYTCNSTSGTYSSNVAVAKLFDATRYLSKNPDKLSTLSHDRLAQYVKDGDCAEEDEHKPRLKHIGDHYFANQTPILPDFDLFKLKSFLEARGVQRVPAPDAKNDIDWVYLTDSGSGQTKGLKAVYRVETAGGKPPATCTGSEQVFIPYAAQYWFYE